MNTVVPYRYGTYSFGIFLPSIVVLGALSGSWSSLQPLFEIWTQQEYSHAWCIPPLALLLFINRLDRVQFIEASYAGVFLATISVGSLLLGWATGNYKIIIYGNILGLIGFAWSSFGNKAMGLLFAPLAYLIFMVPLPIAIYAPISADMQLWSSRLGTGLISLCGVEATLDGNIIVLRSARLEVAEACSGLRYLFPLLSFAYLVAILMADRAWKKTLIVMSSIPIAILLNALRITAIAVLLDRFGLDLLSGPEHSLEGFVVFFLCIVLLLVEVWVLLHIGVRRGHFAMSDILLPSRRAFAKLAAWPSSMPARLATIILVVGTTLVASVPARVEVVPQRQPFALFPMELAGWRGTPNALDGDSLHALDLTDYLLVDYTTDRTAAPVTFFVAYYASQRTGVHIHSPQLCIPGGGWTIAHQSIERVTINGRPPLYVNRAIIEKHGIRQIVYYWFEERGRHIASETALKYYELKDALLNSRTDGALVRVSIPLVGDESAADSTVAELIQSSFETLQLYIPGT